MINNYVVYNHFKLQQNALFCHIFLSVLLFYYYYYININILL